MPRPNEQTIDAADVRPGQTVTGIAAKTTTLWRQRPTVEHPEIRKIHGEWPTVITAKTSHGDLPVALELSDRPGWAYYLAADDQVTVQVAAGERGL